MNEERDVLYVCLAGSATLTVDEESYGLAPGSALIVDKGAHRALVAGADGVRYLTAHVRRPPLTVRPPRQRGDDART